MVADDPIFKPPAPPERPGREINTNPLWIVPDELRRAARVDQAELRIWRERYRHQAPFIREEAAAQEDGRKPNYPPPFARG